MSGSGSRPASRQVEVPPQRLLAFADGVEARHGSVVVTAVAGGLLLTAADGATVRLRPVLGEVCGPVTGLRSLFEALTTERTVGLVLVRRGGASIGVARGGELLAWKSARRRVQGRTAAGGSSQQRFARRRANQAHQAFDAAADAAVAVLLPHADMLVAVVDGGDADGLRAVWSDPRLAALRQRRAGHVLAVAEPRHEVLREAAQRVSGVVALITDPLDGSD